jgi:hypothetical protein
MQISVLFLQAIRIIITRPFKLQVSSLISQIRNNLKILKRGAGGRWRRAVGSIVWKMKYSITWSKGGNEYLIWKKRRQCAYKRYVEARSCNHCCRGRAISNSHSECALVIHIVTCGLSGSTIFFPHYFIKSKIFWEKNIGKMCFEFLYTSCLKHFSF